MTITANDLIKYHSNIPTYRKWPKDWGSPTKDSVLYQWYYFTKYYEQDNYELAVIEDKTTPWGFAFQITAYFLSSSDAIKNPRRNDEKFYAIYGDKNWDIPIKWCFVIGKKAAEKLK